MKEIKYPKFGKLFKGGTIIFCVDGEQYKSVQNDKFYLRIIWGDNWCVHKDSTILLVKNVIDSSLGIKLIPMHFI